MPRFLGRGAAALLAVIAFCGWTPFVSPTRAATYYLDPEGGGDFPTIQAALDASLAGDSILLTAGTYRGDGNRDLVFPPHDLSLIGLAGSEQTVLDVEGGAGGYFDLHGGLTIEGGQSRSCLVQGIKIVDARLLCGMCVIAIASASPTLRDLAIEGLVGEQDYYCPPSNILMNQSDALLEDLAIIGGGYCRGIGIYAGAPALDGVSVRSCYVDDNGAGIRIQNSAALLKGVDVSHCSSSQAGGGIFITGSPAPSLRNVNISHCGVSVHLYGDPATGGGGLYILDSSPTLHDLQVSDCSSVYKGGGIYIDGGSCEIERALLLDNESDSYHQWDPNPGAGIYLKDASPRLERLTVLGCNRTAIFADGVSYPELKYSIVAEGLSGSALGKSTGSAYSILLRCDFWNNVGGSTDGSLPDPVGQDQNFSAPPLFCAEHDPLLPYSLTSGSPCAPANTGWDSPVGAFDVGCDFPAYTISGAVRDAEGLPIAGVSMLGLSGNVVTDTAGYYSCLASAGWPLQVTPQLAGHAFTPPRRDYGIPDQDHYDQDYIGRVTHVYHVPTDSPTLAVAIASAASGDSILVAPGTYAGPGFRDLDPGTKNLVIIGEDGPATTILDLGGAGRAFSITQGQTEAFLLEGFTIRGGALGTSENGGAINVENASPRLKSLWLIENHAYCGGALALRYAAPEITNLLISGNTAAYMGGGIHLHSSDPIIRGCTIAGNRSLLAGHGAGIALEFDSRPVLERSLVARNLAGSGIFIGFNNDMPEFAQSLVYGNLGTDFADRYSGHFDWSEVPGILRADPLFCEPDGGSFTLDADSPCLPGNNPWGAAIGALGLGCDRSYVAVSGLASFNGAPLPNLRLLMRGYEIYTDSTGTYTIMAELGDSLRAEPRLRGYHFDPKYREWLVGDTDISGEDFAASRSTMHWVPEGFADIQDALDNALAGDSVLVSPGVYRGAGNRNLDFRAYDIFLCAPAGPATTIIDCEYAGLGCRLRLGLSRAATIEGFTIRRAGSSGGISCEGGASPTLRQLIIEDCHAPGISCVLAKPLIQDVVCQRNATDSGAGVRLRYSAAILENVTIAFNSASEAGGGINIDTEVGSDDHPHIANCTIAGNSAGESGGGIYMHWDAEPETRPTFERCIVAANAADVIGGIRVWGSGSPTFACNDVFANENGDWSGLVNEQAELNGNFSDDPLFCDPLNGDFHLQSGSPCLPTGNDCRQLIGALGEGCPLTAADPVPASVTALFQNHPNPFNPSTLIRFSLAEPVQVDLAIFDISGRRVVQLLAEPRTRGIHAVRWDGCDERGRPAASGVYFYALTAGHFEARRKLVLLR